MNEWWQTVGAAAIGGGIATVGAVAVEWWKAREALRATARDHRRQNLYDLQDAINEYTDIYLQQLREMRRGRPRDDEATVQLNIAAHRINSQSVRVGDDPLSVLIDALLSRLISALDAPSYREASDSFEAALREDYNHVFTHIGRLLHTNLDVNYGNDTEAIDDIERRLQELFTAKADALLRSADRKLPTDAPRE